MKKRTKGLGRKTQWKIKNKGSVNSILYGVIAVAFLWVSSLNNESYETPVDSTFWVKFIDVGQADAALVECDGHYMLIDGGNKGDSDLIYTVLKIITYNI